MNSSLPVYYWINLFPTHTGVGWSVIGVDCELQREGMVLKNVVEGVRWPEKKVFGPRVSERAESKAGGCIECPSGVLSRTRVC